MIQLRQRKNENFKIIDLHPIQNDNELSWKAKGLHTYLISRPPDWQIRYSDLLKRASDGRASLKSAVQELKERGYLVITQDRQKDGTFADTIWTVTENPVLLPIESPQVDFPPTDNPATENPLGSKEYCSKEEYSKKYDKGAANRTFDFPPDCKNEDVAEAITVYLRRYQLEREVPHPKLKSKQWKQVVEDMEWKGDGLYDDAWREVIEKHFSIDYGCDYNIIHFASGKIIENRRYDLEYY